MTDRNIVSISVRGLVEYVMRSGDLVSGFAAPSRAQEGTWAHQKVQKTWSEATTAEVLLSHRIERPDLVLEVLGRADGILTSEGKTALLEIKSTTRSLEEIEEDSNPVYWAQAKCYAFMYAHQNHLQAIDIHLIYVHIETGQTRTFEKSFAFAELSGFFTDLIDRYLVWAERIRRWVLRRNDSIRTLAFPFPTYRKGQRQLAVAVYRAITGERGKKLFVQAPIGIGKTMATVFPAIKALGEERIDKIFYLTAKTVGRELAENAIAQLKAQGLAIKPLTLTAKEKICFKPGAECNPEVCEFAKGHFDRVNAALEDTFDHEEAFTRPVIETYARKHQVCPFEFSLDLSLWADTVICDYNYVFDPKVYLRRFFLDQGGDYCFLIDEAHNLVDRAREMFSAELTKRPFLTLKRKLKDHLPGIAQALTKINTVFIKARWLCEDEERPFHVQKAALRDLFAPMKKFIKAAETWLVRNQPADFRNELLDLYFQALDFIRVSEYYDERYSTYVELTARDVKVKMFCLDPSYLLREALERGKCAVFFSATLTPLDYFANVLGGEFGDATTRLASPFPRENLCLMVADNVKTTYHARQHTYDYIVEIVTAFTAARKANYLVYLPSYKYQEAIFSRFCAQNSEVRVIRQTPGMSEPEREAFLASFSTENGETLIGFAVMGGVFGEGIDLVGDRLSGCVIVGVSLPQICLERDIIREYFDEHRSLGFEYAYMYPGMNKVLQAAGRVIRSETDRGAVLLIDERFARPAYLDLFPPEWNNPIRVRTPDAVTKTLQAHWRANTPSAFS